MSAAFPHLFQAGRIGAVRLANRLVMPAMDQNLCTGDGLLTEANVDHYEQRARGGVGLLILETSAVSYPRGAASRHQPALSTDACIPGLQALAQRCHPHGAKVFVQLCHHGKTSLVDTVEGRPLTIPTVPLPPFDTAGYIRDLTFDEMMKMAERMHGAQPSYHQLTTDEIAAIIDDFATAAERVQLAGLDGIEVHGCHGYLISTFLSPHWNQRTDEYGGSLAGRTRLLREVVEAIRTRCGPDFGITVRLDGAEFGIDDGITSELAADHALAAVVAGADAIHVSAMGAPDSGPGFTDGPIPWKPGQYRDLVAAIRARVDVPVIAVGRIDADLGDEMIAAGEADFVAMGRQLLADPDTARRLRSGRRELVRPCINCFVCVAQNFWDDTPRCAVNARLGRLDAPPIVRAAATRRIVVVGGGPGGMEAARVAAERGHRVTLIERASTLGGTARFSSVTTPINGQLVDHLEAAVAAVGVDVRLGTNADVDLVRSLDADHVIVATGASRRRPELPGADLAHVLTGDDLRDMLVGGSGPSAALPNWQRPMISIGQRLGLTRPDRVRTLSQRWMPIGNRVVVLGGGLVGVEIAEFLAERGRAVVVLEPGQHIGSEMAHPRRWRTLHQARSHGVRFVPQATVTEITGDHVAYDVVVPAVEFGAEPTTESTTTPADHVIVASEVHPGAPLAHDLIEVGIDVTVIGDANEVGYIEGAMRSGHDAGCLV